jgi:2-hydroxychromene-2-carboxylate isomerase
MGSTVQFWFEFASTYSYLSAMRVDQLAARRGLTVDWRPFLLGPVFAEQGWKTSPFNIYPAKGRYMWRDMERLCTQRGLPLVRPDPFPQNGLKAARLTLAIDDPAQRAGFVCAVYEAEFGQGRDISADEVLTECLTAAGLTPSFLDHAQDPDIKAALFEQSRQAKALGLFGAPSFLVGEELFWGDDRLEDALAWAAKT